MIRPSVVVVLMVVLAVIFHGGVLTTIALLVGVVALAFAVIALFDHLP